MNQNHLVITGMGAVTPIGIGVESYWNNLIKGVSGVDRIRVFDPSGLPVQIAAEVKNFDPLDYLPKTLVKATDRFMQFAIIAAKQALAQSKLNIAQNSDRIGIVMGTAMDGVSCVANTQHSYSTGAAKKIGPRFVPMVIGNIAAAQVAIEYGIHGPSFTVNTACSSGGDAMMLAAMLLGSGEADAEIGRAHV